MYSQKRSEAGLWVVLRDATRSRRLWFGRASTGWDFDFGFTGVICRVTPTSSCHGTAKSSLCMGASGTVTRVLKIKRPTTNRSFWHKKLEENVARDKRIRRKLHRIGWKVLVVWQCETRKPEKLLGKLEMFLHDE